MDSESSLGIQGAAHSSARSVRLSTHSTRIWSYLLLCRAFSRQIMFACKKFAVSTLFIAKKYDYREHGAHKWWHPDARLRYNYLPLHRILRWSASVVFAALSFPHHTSTANYVETQCSHLVNTYIRRTTCSLSCWNFVFSFSFISKLRLNPFVYECSSDDFEVSSTLCWNKNGA